MILNQRRIVCCGSAMVLTLMLAAVASAASSLSNSLTGFTGNSTLPATQAAVAAAGLNFYSTAGLDDEFTMDPTVGFDGTGATFGGIFFGDGGRNYMRTNDSDYVSVDFVAEVTVERSSNNQQAFFGMGAGQAALFGVPDWSTFFSSTFLTPEDGSLTYWRSSNDVSIWTGDDPPSTVTAAGTHRLQMTFDATAKTVTYAMDADYAGGAFAADFTAPAVDLSSSITCPGDDCGGGKVTNFFGSDFWDASEYTLWRDLQGSSEGTYYVGNFDNTGASMDVVDEADYDYLKANFGQVRSPGWPDDPSRIYFGGDDGAIFRDFSVVVSAAGGGAASVVPEPSAIVLLVCALGGVLALRRER